VAPTTTENVDGDTETVATGTSVTVAVDVPGTVSQVAVIVADPAATAVTVAVWPGVVTVATDGLLEAHVIVRPVRTLLLASLTVAVNNCVEPTDFVKLDGDTETVATAAGGAADNVPVDVPVLVSHVAVMTTVPGASTVTNPLEETVASALLLLLHVTTRPVRVLLLASFRVATSCCVCPTVLLNVPGLTVTVATGTATTFAVLVPVMPAAVALIVATPVVTPVTTPEAFTLATAELFDDHANEVATVLPPASRATAVSAWVAPTCTENGDGVTVTLAIAGDGAAVTVAVEAPWIPSEVAVIVAEPATTPVTNPVALTVATAVLLLCQVTTLPARMLFEPSRVVAVSC
jgi:hypothetical protein